MLQKERAGFSPALFILIFWCFFLSSCQNSLNEHLSDLALHSSLNQSLILETSNFTLLGWGKNQQTQNINIYLEGDGQAWQDPWTISEDPTPSDPMGFKLALADTRSDSVLYLTRPCQYTKDKRCTPLDWTSHRFSQKIIDAYHEAFEKIKEIWHVKSFNLHAYSGGATIALLLAAQRQDICSVTTFAPLLDPGRWTQHHNYSPLSGSLTPMHYKEQLKLIPQKHFIGLEDREIPLPISESYFKEFPKTSLFSLYKIPHFTHYSDWPAFWKSYILHS